MTEQALSAAALAGALLQFAKQGLSLVHGNRQNCPNGRQIGSQVLRDIIWQGRNQASNWESGQLQSQVIKFFQTLAQEQDPKFSDYNKRNLAMEIIESLGWRDFCVFRANQATDSDASRPPILGATRCTWRPPALRSLVMNWERLDHFEGRSYRRILVTVDHECGLVIANLFESVSGEASRQSASTK
jgi:hypothetical protein